MIIYNQDMRSKDYGEIKDKLDQDMLILHILKSMELEIIEVEADHRQRNTARVAAGAIAKKILEKKLGKKFKVTGAVAIGNSWLYIKMG